MAISVSLVLVFAAAVWLLYRYAGLKSWHALACIAFGFSLATSRFAPVIQTLLADLIRAITGKG